MKRVFFLISFLFFFLISLNLVCAPYEVPGPYGGKLVINIGEIQQHSPTDFGAEFKFNYENFSIIPGYVYNGTVKGGFSYLGSTSELWIDFYKDSNFDITYSQGKINVYFPVSISFDFNLKSFKCIKVEAWEGKTPQLLINDAPFDVTPEILQYLIPLQSLK